jgi:hypothetical protein
MTKRDWRRANQQTPDPGVLIDVDSEPSRPSRWTGPKELEEREAELTNERSERECRSKWHDIKLAGRNSLEWLIQLSESRKREKLGLRLTSLDKAVLEMAKKWGK